MKTAIVYKTKWGATKQYCEWLREKYPDFELYNMDEINIDNLNEYERIVFASRVDKGDVSAREFLEDNWQSLEDKQLYLILVGLNDNTDKEVKETYEKLLPLIRESFSDYVRLPTRTRIEELNFLQRILAKGIVSKKQSTSDIHRDSLKTVYKWFENN